LEYVRPALDPAKRETVAIEVDFGELSTYDYWYWRDDLGRETAEDGVVLFGMRVRGGLMPSDFRRFRTPALLTAVAAIVVAGGWPGERPSANRIGWSESGPGLRLERPSQALSELPLWSTSGELSLELWLAPVPDPGRGNQEIVSLVAGRGGPVLLLGQWPAGLFLRSRSDNPTGDPKRDHYGDFPPFGISHLAVTAGPGGTRLHVNGRERGVLIPGVLAQSGAPIGGRLLLGSSATGWGEWRGGIIALALYDRSLSPDELRQHASIASSEQLVERGAVVPAGLMALYLLDEGRGRRAESWVAGAPALVLPELVVSPTTPVLSFALPHSGLMAWFPRDLAVNLLGFVPLGLLVAWAGGRRGLVAATVFGASLSLLIELAQVWIPGRDSSGIDLICNALGALLGGVLSLAVYAWAESWLLRRRRSGCSTGSEGGSSSS
jgi:hypothetical protein